MRIGAALHCEIRPSVFARKNYFYPDQAKDYQISQYDLPLNANGWLELPDGSHVGVTRAHMEEDTGKLTHVGASGRINAADHALVDYNRSGVPLVEIVSEPDIRSAAQARAYASELRGILVATGASDGRMEEGSMRVDANVSVRPAGATRSVPAAKSRTSTRCARWCGRSSTRPHARSLCSRAAAWWRRRPGTGTSRQDAPSPCGPKKRRTTTATSPSPTSFRWRRTWPGRQRVHERLGPLPADRRGALAAALGGAPSEAETDQIRAVVDLGPGRAGDCRGRRGGARRTRPGPGGQRGRGAGRGRIAPRPRARSPRCWGWSRADSSPRRSPRRCWRHCSRAAAGATPPRWPRRWVSRPWRPTRLSDRARRDPGGAPRRVGALLRRRGQIAGSSSPAR